jgi:hypothetical protein
MNDEMTSAESKKRALAMLTAALPRAIEVLIDLLDSADKELGVAPATRTKGERVN